MDTETFQKFNMLDVRPRSPAARFFGVNMVFSNGHVWRRHRKVCNPAFHRSWSTAAFGERARALMARIEQDGLTSVEVYPYLQRYASSFLFLLFICSLYSESHPIFPHTD